MVLNLPAPSVVKLRRRADQPSATRVLPGLSPNAPDRFDASARKWPWRADLRPGTVLQIQREAVRDRMVDRTGVSLVGGREWGMP